MAQMTCLALFGPIFAITAHHLSLSVVYLVLAYVGQCCAWHERVPHQAF